jgi:hypothetical protein
MIVGTAMKYPIKKLWQGCGKNPDFAAKTDTIDNFSRDSQARLTMFTSEAPAREFFTAVRTLRATV